MTQLLVVDDDEDFAGAIRMVLQSRGFEVAMESDPAKALERIQQRQPDAVILDVMFPEDPVAGVNLAQTLRSKFPKLPILMLTAISQQMPLAFSSRDIDPETLSGHRVSGKADQFPHHVRQTRPAPRAADNRHGREPSFELRWPNRRFLDEGPCEPCLLLNRATPAGASGVP